MGGSGSAVTLGELAEIAAASQQIDLIGDPGTPVADLHHDSRQVEHGTAFAAVPGTLADGHDYIAAALRRGATALVVERAFSFDVPQLVVESVRPLLGPLAAAVHGHPSQELTVVGVTGTNGKTTVTHMLEAILTAAGRHAAVLGTLGARIDGVTRSVGHTTPEATDLQRLFRQMVDGGVDTVAMEVSSHAIAYGRIDGISFDVAAFTNLSQDHLDFHGHMEDYYRTKAQLFAPDRSSVAVIALDDPWGRRLASEVSLPTLHTGVIPGGIDGEHLDIVAFDVRSNPWRSTFNLILKEPSTTFDQVALPVGGWFNVSNALVAIGCALGLGVSAEVAVGGLDRMPGVPGRLEAVDAGQDFAVVVDYAHTPEAIERTIEALRPALPARIIAVGGAGGDRDRGKRPLMGAALATADVAILTSDNPRSEDPEIILDEVRSGIDPSSPATVHVEVDRVRAIDLSIETATDGDVVAILGKGHETGQEIAGVVTPFDDREVARRSLERRLGGDRS